jgi:hypothetical protein
MKPSDEVKGVEKEGNGFTNLDDLKMKTAERRKMEFKLQRLAHLNAAKKEAEEEISGLKEELTPWLLSMDARKVSFGGKRFRVGDGASVSISKELLLQNGVTADVIVASTVRKTYTTIYVTEDKVE